MRCETKVTGKKEEKKDALGNEDLGRCRSRGTNSSREDHRELCNVKNPDFDPV